MFKVPVVRILLLLFLSAAVVPGDLQADSIRLLGDWSYSDVKTETEDKTTGEVREGSSDRFQQTYRLDINKQLYPNLTINTGVQVEDNQFTSQSEEGETDTRDMQVLPYIDAELRTPLYAFSGGYRERYARQTGSALLNTEKDFLKSYNLRGQWLPLDLPRLEINYIHSEQYDDPLTRERESDIVQLNSRYEIDDYEFLYNFLSSEDRDLLNGTETQVNTHNGQVRYARGLFDDRVRFSSSLRAEHSRLSFSGTGEREFEVFPTGSSFFLSDADALPDNNDPADYTAGNFGGNLDLNGSENLAFGLAFGEMVKVDLLQLSLSAELVSNTNILNTGNWAVYVSDDQETWVSRTVVGLEYRAEENLLKINFSPQANHEFILVVYTPPLITGQTEEVLVTTLRAFVVRTLNDGTELTTRTHSGRLGIGWEATEKTRFAYNLNVQESSSDLFDEQRMQMSNNLNVIHRFDDVFIGTARVSVADSWDQGDHVSTSYSYSARLSANYLETLNQSLVYSGSTIQDEEGEGSSNSVILRTNAELYRGWDMSLDQGYGWDSPAQGEDSSSFFIRVQNSVVPHRRYTVIADYSIFWEQIGDEAFERSETGRLRWFLVPSDTLSLSGEIQLRKTVEETDVFWQYSASWLPFRDGDLQFTLTYSEEEDRHGNLTRVFSPAMNWEVTHYADLSLRYSQGTRETDDDIDDFRTVQLNLRVYYD